MSVYFFDASAVVKYFHREPGSAWIRQLADEREPGRERCLNDIYMADISLAEVPAALSVLSRTGQIRNRICSLMYDAFMGSIGDRFRILRVTQRM